MPRFFALFLFAALLFFRSYVPANAVIVVPDEFDTKEPNHALWEFVCNSWELTQPNFAVYGSYIFGAFGRPKTIENHLFYRPGHYVSRMASMKVYVRGNRILTIPELPPGIGAEIELYVRHKERKHLSFPPHPTEAQPARHILIIDPANPVFLKNNAPFSENPPTLTAEELREKFGTDTPEFVETISASGYLFVEFEFLALTPNDAEIRQILQKDPVATESLFPQTILKALNDTLLAIRAPFPSQAPAGNGGSWGSGGYRDDFFFKLTQGVSPVSFGKIPRWAKEPLQFRTNHFCKNLHADYQTVFTLENARTAVLRKFPHANIPNFVIHSPREKGVTAINQSINSFRKKKTPDRTDFGMLGEIKFPENTHVYLEGFGNALSNFSQKSVRPLIRHAYFWDSSYTWERESKEFFRKKQNTESAIAVTFNLDKSDVPGFFLKIGKNEINLTAGKAEHYEFALALLEKILSSESVPEDTLLICVFPEGSHDPNSLKSTLP